MKKFVIPLMAALFCLGSNTTEARPQKGKSQESSLSLQFGKAAKRCPEKHRSGSSLVIGDDNFRVVLHSSPSYRKNYNNRNYHGNHHVTYNDYRTDYYWRNRMAEQSRQLELERARIQREQHERELAVMRRERQRLEADRLELERQRQQVELQGFQESIWREKVRDTSDLRLVEWIRDLRNLTRSSVLSGYDPYGAEQASQIAYLRQLRIYEAELELRRLEYAKDSSPARSNELNKLIVAMLL